MQPNTDRLRTLATEILPSIPDQDFSIRYWRCNSLACAVGHSAMHPKFNQEGFSLIQSDVSSTVSDQAYTPQYVNPETGETLTSWEAVQAFFGLTEYQAEHLFHPTSYPNRHALKTEVIDRILTLIQRVEQ